MILLIGVTTQTILPRGGGALTYMTFFYYKKLEERGNKRAQGVRLMKIELMTSWFQVEDGAIAQNPLSQNVTSTR